MSEVARLETWRQRLDGWMMYVPFGALLASSAMVPIAAAAGLPHLPFPVTALVVLVTAGWLLWWVSLHPQWRNDRGRMTVFFAGLVALIFLLVWCSSFYGFFAWTGYLYAGYALRGRLARLAGVSVMAVATALAQAGGLSALAEPSSRIFFAVLLFFNLLVANALTLIGAMNDEQSAKRVEMIDELARANAALEEAMRENAGLHAQLLVQAREAGVHDERQRMAGEIHDVLAQGLTGIVTQLEAASATPGPASARHIDAARKLARESLAEARRSVQALRPQPLDSAALVDALGEVVSGWSALHGVPASLITTGVPRSLLPEIETTLLRTAQEALANVARHAAAGRVVLTLSYMEDVVTLDVRDDGAGFDPSAVPDISEEGGFGLVGMRERLGRIAGTLEVESEPGAGTALSAAVPAIAVGAAA
ncbi:sensor histidine kinase [Actinoplanes sp. CA-030573]|uniref:sensor histidine kinase n=1 Tax=Actinoplanes sp. CA-030573 TaxID=3239898 RepID=UPI003D8C5A2F